jgi:hypothetical protein
VSERAWGTVREDYSADGDAWRFFPFDHARSRAYRWNEDGLGGICDEFQVEFPAGSGRQLTLGAVADEICTRLVSIVRDAEGRRPVFGETALFHEDPAWHGLLPFHEYVHGDSGAGSEPPTRMAGRAWSRTCWRRDRSAGCGGGGAQVLLDFHVLNRVLRVSRGRACRADRRPRRNSRSASGAARHHGPLAMARIASHGLATR